MSSPDSLHRRYGYVLDEPHRGADGVTESIRTALLIPPALVSAAIVASTQKMQQLFMGVSNAFWEKILGKY